MNKRAARILILFLVFTASVGVQFHPESVMTPDGKIMIENFIDVVRGGRKQ